MPYVRYPGQSALPRRSSARAMCRAKSKRTVMGASEDGDAAPEAPSSRDSADAEDVTGRSCAAVGSPPQPQSTDTPNKHSTIARMRGEYRETQRRPVLQRIALISV